MKHLKKLSVVLMLTALFSVTFTSCIDNEVSPLVEAIYEAQADLIAAQANVQNAEATKLEAEAAYNLALAASANADAAYTLEEVEKLRIANAAAQIVVDKAQAQFNIDLAFLLADLEEAGAQIALDYALKYRTYANAATNLLDDKADAVYDLALAQAQANSSYPLFAIQALETVVANAQYQVEVNEAEIAALQALIDDPTSLPAQVTAWEAELDALDAAIDAKEAEMEVKIAERDNLIAGSDGEDDVRDNFVQEYEGYVLDSLQMSNDIEAFQDIIDNATTALATYDADLAAAEAAVTVADDDVTDAWLALGAEVAFDGYYTLDAGGDAIAIGGEKYDPATNLQEEYVNARIDYLDAQDDLADYQADFDALVLTYNTAAVNLAAAQVAFDAADYAGDLQDAQDDLDDVEDDLDDAEDIYTAAKLAFEADPTGSVTTDGDGNHSAAYYPAFNSTFDLGNTGIDSDLAPDTYMRVATWKETTLGSGNYIPATLYPTKYNTADLAVEAAALIAAVNGITANTDIWLWEDDALPSDMPINDLDGTPAVLTPAEGIGNNADLHAFGATDAIAADGENIAVFINVESDDASVTKLYTFNVATNMFGTDDFSDRAFFTSGSGTVGDPYVFEAALVSTDLNAGYDSTPNANGIADGATDMFTAQALLWNAQLEVFMAQNAFDLGDDVLAAAQAVFDYQQELFDNGVANLALLAADLDAADTAQDDAQDDVDAAWVELGAEIAEGEAGDPLIVAPVTLNEVLYNAEVTLADLEACDEDCLQTSIDDAQHEIDLIQPALDGIVAIIAEMQAQYDIYIATYVPGPSTSYDNLDADLKVLYNALTFEIFELNQELNALDAQYDAIDDILDSLDNDDNLSDISLDIELAILYDTSQGSYLDSLNDLDAAEAALATALAGNDIAANAAYIAHLQSVVDVLEQRYQNALALAAKYKALMEAALAS
jgi:hypothetical protein